ncbi:MAG TPA: glucose 1-dehydrogenase [Nevskiaceae bacterium]|nr:glucose 1-dehydrogenase [Nevskiaceae bacterium]
MRAITVVPGKAGSARLDDIGEPDRSEGAVLAQMLAMGVCGTDAEILRGEYGWAPAGNDRLVLGHESLARVIEAPADCGLKAGDHVVGIVRRPDPEPCPSCAVGEWDMCRNGLYTERGIKQRNGYGAERVRLETDFAVPVDRALGICGVLLEPASVVAKAWDQVERVGARSKAWAPNSALITGAGPVGLLAALLGVQRGLDVHVYDRVETGLKPQLVRELGATYHAPTLDSLGDLHPDIVIECTGATPVVVDSLARTAAMGIVCLAGVSSGGHKLPLDVGSLNREMVLENDVVFGTVNANRHHYELGAEALARADRAWLEKLITRRVPLSKWQDAFQRRDDDVKVVLEFASA